MSNESSKCSIPPIGNLVLPVVTCLDLAIFGPELVKSLLASIKSDCDVTTRCDSSSNAGVTGVTGVS